MSAGAAASVKPRKRHTYTKVGAGVDHDGWYKFTLRRDDGREVKVQRGRLSQLRREGRLS